MSLSPAASAELCDRHNTHYRMTGNARTDSSVVEFTQDRRNELQRNSSDGVTNERASG
jgi:hypothetical protein